MAMDIPVIAITIVVVGVIAVIVYRKVPKEKRKLDFTPLAGIGAALIPVGIATGNMTFSIIGIVYIGIGIISLWKKIKTERKKK